MQDEKHEPFLLSVPRLFSILNNDEEKSPRPPDGFADQRHPHRRNIKLSSIPPKRRNAVESEFILNENSEYASKLSTHLLLGEEIDPNTPIEILGLIIKDLEYRRDIFIQKGAFSESVKALNAVDHVKELQIDSVKRAAQQEQLEEIRLRRGHMKTDLKIFNHIKKAHAQNMRSKCKERVKNTEIRHQKELEEHEKKWNEPSMQRLYNRRSSNLVNLRNQYKRLLLAKKFAEAEQTKKFADELEAKEYDEAQRRFEQEFLVSKQQLIQRHNQEIETLKENNSLKLEVLKKKSQIEKLSLINRKKAIQHQEENVKDLEKNWRLYHKVNEDPKPTSRSTRMELMKINMQETPILQKPDVIRNK